MKLRTETQLIAVDLTDDELRHRGQRLAELHGVLDELAEEESEFKADLKRRRKPVKAEVSTLAHAIRNKRENRDVDVEIHYDPKRGLVDEIRADTGEVLATRKPKREERQAQLMALVPKAEDR